MKDSQLSDCVERLTRRLVDQHSIVGDRRHKTLVNEGIDELSRGRLVDIRRRHLDCTPVPSERFDFESFVIGCRLVTCIWTSHGKFTFRHALRARLAPSGADKLARSTMTDPPHSSKCERSTHR